MTAPRLSVVIPTYNMAGFLPALWESFRTAGVLDVAEQVLFVNDGSTDDTAQVVRSLGPQAELLDLDRNRGRFMARLLGARAARGDRLVFIDSRVILPPDFGVRLREVASQARNVVGMVDIDTTRSTFCLYWDRSHRVIFWRHFRDTRVPLTLTPENFDRYLKGTTVFVCDRDLFVATCERLQDAPLLNDDTFLMKRMVQREPLVVHPGLRIHWVPRETWREFLGRLWERGPSFAEYHVFAHQGVFFWVVMAGLAACSAWLALLLAAPVRALGVAGAALATTALSTAAFARSPGELLRLAPLHTAVVFTFGIAIMRGIFVNLFRKLRRATP